MVSRKGENQVFRHALAALSLAAGFTASVTADTITLNPTADARILSFSPNQNGSVDILSTYNAPGNEQRTVIQFDLGAVPPGEMINNAVLRLYGHSFFGSVQPTSLDAYRVTNPWNEASVTWLSASTGAPWSAAGGDLVGTSGSPLTNPYATWSGAQSPAYSWFELNVTGLISQHYSGAFPNYGIGLAGPVGSQLTYIQSEGGGAGFDQIPELVIDYAPVPEPGTLVLIAGLVVLSKWRGSLARIR